MPSLEVFGYRLVEQRALGVARVVELGFEGGPELLLCAALMSLA